MKLAVIFNGQGAHYEGMGLDFVQAYPEAKEIFDLAEESTGLSVRRLVGEEIDQLAQTRYAQVAIMATSLAIFASVSEQLPEPAYMAGLSLGEYSALVASGMLDAPEAFRLIQKRGDIMGNHCEYLSDTSEIQMCAVMKMPLDEIKAIVETIHSEDSPLYVANMNASHQTTLAGTKTTIDEFTKAAKEAGYRKPIPLKVEGPFHSPMMEGARKPFEKVLAETDFHEARTPVISNTTLEAHRPDTVKETLSRHLVESVHWVQTMEFFKAEGVTHIIQIGPGETLARLLKREKESIPCLVIDKLEDVDGIEAFFEGGDGQ